MKKYAVHPGHVTSTWDGERHFVSTRKLIRLHKVNPSECVEVPFDDPVKYVGREYAGLIHLFPEENYDDYGRHTKEGDS
jgi:hypothetical protein